MSERIYECYCDDLCDDDPTEGITYAQRYGMCGDCYDKQKEVLRLLDEAFSS